ncbi:unnamed protein product [Toxocara canis]|uniref:Abhydro_lipase domain-containing protein n=1 Tax=Toxocara canis TaxID=6265 RepID=A0A183U0V2_TOXCA|nr:unnamed protein product [Toxocara canis]
MNDDEKQSLIKQIMCILAVILLSALVRCSFSVQLPEADMSVPELIAYYGYPIEEHTAITEDGHHLVLHRIPNGIRENGMAKYVKRPVIFLQHGFVGSSAVWVTNLPSQSAGFVFADAGFDVWMGNARGNTYSVNHTSFTRDDDEYWKFTFDEISRYDLETMIDKALNVTGQTTVFYVGHSEGSVTMFAKLATDPAFSSKLSRFFAFRVDCITITIMLSFLI